MKFAYADPPYFGQGAKHYGNLHAKAADWDNPIRHAELIAQLGVEFPDGWAMSLSSPTLRTILPMCPSDVRVAAWVKSFCAFKKGVRPCYAWEPVIFRSLRNPPHQKHAPPMKGGKQNTPKDFIIEPITLKKGLTGAKPHRFNLWVLDLLNIQTDDEVVDMFPGTGGMSHAITERARTMAHKLGVAAEVLIK